MAQEDVPFCDYFETLDIDTAKKKGKAKAEGQSNPFMRRPRSKSLSSINFGPTCDCVKKAQSVKHTTSFKRSTAKNKVLRDPVFKFVKCTNHRHNRSTGDASATDRPKREDRLFGQHSRHNSTNNNNNNDKHHHSDFRSIVDACELLSITGSGSDIPSTSNSYTSESFQNARVPNAAATTATLTADPKIDGSAATVGTSCSHQARLNATAPCDVTIDELASYFETFVHIPKKMSSMAEMMYI